MKISQKNVNIIISCTEKLFIYLYIYVLGWTLGVIPHLTEWGQKDVRTDLNRSFFHENKKTNKQATKREIFLYNFQRNVLSYYDCQIIIYFDSIQYICRTVLSKLYSI